MARSCKCFGLYDQDKIIGIMGVLHQPHGKNKKLKRVSRLVILPDYQGIGLGTKFLNEVAKHYTRIGYDFSIVTSAKNMIAALSASNEWIMISYKATQPSTDKSAIDYNRKTMRRNCRVGSFRYQQNENEQLRNRLGKTQRKNCKTDSFFYKGNEDGKRAELETVHK